MHDYQRAVLQRRLRQVRQGGGRERIAPAAQSASGWEHWARVFQAEVGRSPLGSADGGLDDVGVGMAPRLARVGGAIRHRHRGLGVSAEEAGDPLEDASSGRLRGRGEGCGGGREVGMEICDAGSHRLGFVGGRTDAGGGDRPSEWRRVEAAASQSRLDDLKSEPFYN